MRARRRPPLTRLARATLRCAALVALIDLLTTSSSASCGAAGRVAVALLRIADREPTWHVARGLHVRGLLAGDGLVRRRRWGWDLLLRRGPLLMRGRCGASDGGADGHVGGQAALGGVEAGLDEVLSFGLGDEGLELCGGEGVDEPCLGDDEQEDLCSCECRELVRFLHNTCNNVSFDEKVGICALCQGH